MRHLDLFSGFGGFALAARWVGIETVGFCEIEEFPRKVLQKNFSGIPIHHDIRELDGSEYEGIDIITGGYPCQPFSLAGNRCGENDNRHLWPEMLRVIKQARPTWIVSENVSGHITMGLDSVLFDLEGEGYSARAVTIPACAVDAPHKRERLWIVAHSNEKQEGAGRHKWMQGRKRDDWPGLVLPGRGGVDDGIPNWLDRVGGCGNAIVPQVAYEIFSAIKLVD